MAELKFKIFTIDIKVWRELLVATTNLIWIRCDHLKSIVSVLAIRLEPVSSVWPSRDSVSISLRSCVDFVRSAQVEIVYRFRRDRVSILPDVRWNSAQI